MYSLYIGFCYLHGLYIQRGKREPASARSLTKWLNQRGTCLKAGNQNKVLHIYSLSVAIGGNFFVEPIYWSWETRERGVGEGLQNKFPSVPSIVRAGGEGKKVVPTSNPTSAGC